MAMPSPHFVLAKATFPKSSRAQLADFPRAHTRPKDSVSCQQGWRSVTAHTHRCTHIKIFRNPSRVDWASTGARR